MARKESQHGADVLTIESPAGSARASFVPEFGGIGSSLVMPSKSGPRELLFLHDFFWDRPYPKTRGGWPFLFPTCGRLCRDGKDDIYLFEGRRYELPSHGFSLRVPWQVADASRPDALVLRLAADTWTRERYPFEFEIVLAYRIEDRALVCEQTYANRGDRPMPYYAGFHPYFLTPEPERGKDKALLHFDATRRMLYNERLNDLVGSTEAPASPVGVSDPAINEMLAVFGADKSTTLVLPDGFSIHMAAEGVEDRDLFPYLQLYTIPEKPFFCVEPWMAFPNALNTVRGVRWIPPRSAEHGILRLWVTEG
jgi:galactose mutarotase-like enzyme